VSGGLLRTDAVAALARHRADMLSLVTMRAVPVWISLGQADDRNLNVLGCMGSAAAIGLGLALARPDDRILVIDGDGSLLMQLGTLVSVAGQAPANMYHVVMENGTYETSGGQDVPGRQVADLRAVAAAAGYRHAFRFASADEIHQELPRCLRLDGPVFISLLVAGPGEEPRGAYERLPGKPAEIQNMRRALALQVRAGALAYLACPGLAVTSARAARAGAACRAAVNARKGPPAKRKATSRLPP
jgi:sulfopyruvate decarboxylase subunit beta